MRPTLWTFLAALVLCAPIACAGTQEKGPLSIPDVTTRVDHYYGSAVSGPVRGAWPEIKPEETARVGVRLVAFEDFPEGRLASLVERAQIVATNTGEGWVLSSTYFTRGARVGWGPEAAALLGEIEGGAYGRHRDVALLEGALPREMTSAFLIEGKRQIRVGDGRFGRVALDVFVHRAALGPATDQLSLSLAIGLRHDPGTAGTARPDQGVELRSRQQAILRGDRIAMGGIPLAGSRPIVLVSHGAFAQGEGDVFAIVIDVRSPAEDPAAAFDPFDPVYVLCKEDVADASRFIESETRMVKERVVPRQPQDMLAALRKPGSRRHALIHLAGATGAALMEDLALTCSGESIDSVAARVAERIPSLAATDDLEVAWVLESVALRHILDESSRGTVALSHRGALVLRLGELGRHPADIEEILGKCSTMEEFRARAVEKNRQYLAHSKVATRARAYRWLAERGQAPEGFDPLASSGERRRALKAAAEAEAAAKAEAKAAASRPAASAPGGGTP